MMFNSRAVHISLNVLIEWRTKVYTDTFKFWVSIAASVKKANRMPAKIRGNINNKQYFQRVPRKTKGSELERLLEVIASSLWVLCT